MKNENQSDSLPYFKFYPGDWLSGSIQGYDMALQGIFINLMAHAWRRGGWVELNERLARQLNMSFEDLSNAVAMLNQCFGPLILEGNLISSKFVLLQLKELDDAHRKRVQAGRKGGKASVLSRASNAQAMLKQCSSKSESESESESDKKEKKNKKERWKKPTADEITEYAKSIEFELDGQGFVDFYESKGWMIGKNKMKNWKSAVQTWKRKERNEKVNGRRSKRLEGQYIEQNRANAIKRI